MTTLDAINARHAVRKYIDKALPTETVSVLTEEINTCNAEGGLHIQLAVNEPRAFDGFMAHYGSFSGVKNYIALIGKKSAGLDEKAGYYGERIVLKAQALGLNTCWVAMSFSKGPVRSGCTVGPGEKLVCVISLGYGETQGVPHRSKPINALYSADSEIPGWFLSGVEAAALAPTAVNQQKFRFILNGSDVKCQNLGGPYSKVDLGIAEYHFDIGSGRNIFGPGIN